MSAAIFNGNLVKILKNTLKLGSSVTITGGTLDPQATPIPGNTGDVYISSTTGNIYVKQDSGSSSNWTAPPLTPAAFTDKSVIFSNPSGTLVEDNANFFYDSGTATLTVSNLTVSGTQTSINSTNLDIKDKIVTLNKGGAASSALGSGIEFEEAGSITGYLLVSADRNSFKLKAPNQAGETTITPGASGITLDQSSHNPVTIGTANGLSVLGQVISLSIADGSTTGALSSTDWNTFNGKQNALGFTPENVANKDTDGTLAANSDVKYPSQKAIKTYTDNGLSLKEPVITATTSADYYRGDKTFQPLNTGSVPENGNLYYTQGRFDTAFAAKSTTNLTEGSNLYFTNARARAAVSATAPLVDTAGVFSIPVATNSVDGYLSSTDYTSFAGKEPAITAGTTLQYFRGDKSFQTLDTLAVPENTNLYYTAARFNTAFASKDTGALTEGSNLYFTNARARSALSVDGGSDPLAYNSATGVFSMPAAATAQSGYLSSTDWNTFNNKPSSINNKIYYVSNNGNDSNIGYDINKPFLTLGAALTAAGNSGNQICVTPGTYTGNYTISNQNVTITTVGKEPGGLVLFTGTLTVSNSSSSVRIANITIDTVNHTGAGSLYLDQVKINTALSSSNSGYLQVSSSEIVGPTNTATISVTGSGTKVFNNGSQVGAMTVNNASAIVNSSNNVLMFQVTLSAGIMLINNTPVYSPTGTTNSIVVTGASSVLYLTSVNLLTPTNTAARMSIAAASFYSLRASYFDKVNSVLSGTNLSQDMFTDGINTNSYKSDLFTASTVPVINSSKQIVSSSVTATQLGYVDFTSSGQTQLNGKQNTLTIGNITDAGTDGITVSGGTGAIIGAGVSLSQHVADSTHNGYLSQTDWNIFNSKQAALGFTAENSANKGIANGYASLDASALIPITQIPPAALERLVVVADQTARFALTTASVQNGDTVKQTDTGAMYFVIDETNLGNSSGYSIYTAGTASSVAWSGITGIPAPVTALSGTNTGDQTITLTGDVTGSGTGSFAATIAANAVSNSKLAQMAAHTFKGNNTGSTANAIDLTATQLTAELDVFTSVLQGVAPASSGGTTNFLRADGTWAAPPSSGGTVTTVSVATSNGFAGSVANATSTPAITVSTTVTGILKGNGTAISAATAGTDYLAPITGDISHTSFTAADNQSSAADVTGFVFANAVTRSFDAIVSVVRGATYSQYKIQGIQKAASWELNQSYVGDITGITFSITSSGQVQYTSTSTGNSATVKFRAQSTLV